MLIHGVLAIDYETDGLDPERGARPFLVGCEDERGRVRMWEIGGPGPHGSYDWDGPRHRYLQHGTPEALKRAVNDPKVDKLAHNAKFELRMSRALGWAPRGKWHDTMQQAPLDNEYQRLGLDKLSQSHFGTTHPESVTIWKWIDKENANRRKVRRAQLREIHGKLDAKQIKYLLELDPPTEATFKDFYLDCRAHKELMVRYLEKDLDDTLRLYWFYRKPMRALYREPCAVERRLVKHVARIEDDGIRVDVPYIQERVDHYTPIIHASEDRLCELAGSPNFNPNSPPQVMAVLRKRKIDVASTGKDILKPFETKDDFVNELLNFREKTKVVGTFFQNLLDKQVGGFIHASFWQNGQLEGVPIRTGRFSCSNPNLQNIPKRTEMGREVRRAFIPRDGFDLYAIDYRQIEPKLMAHYANDQRLIEEFASGIDPYIIVGEFLFGEKLHDKHPLRNQAKIITLAILYGMGVGLMAERLGIDSFLARGMRSKYFETFPQVRKLTNDCQVELARYGYVEDIFGRRYRVPRGLGYKSINAKIQGTAAGVIKRAMVRVGDEIERRYRKSLGVKIVSQVHDELLIEAPQSFAGKLAMKRCAELMEDRTTFSLPLVVSAEVGCPSWADKKKFAMWENHVRMAA